MRWERCGTFGPGRATQSTRSVVYVSNEHPGMPMKNFDETVGQRLNGISTLTRSRGQVALVSTYPPAMCGLATFTESLRGALAVARGDDRGLDVIELMDDRQSPPNDRQEVLARLDPADPTSMRTAAERLAGHDVVILQHEYGIWGPHMGRGVIEFAEMLRSGLITTLHTLLPRPSLIQEEIIKGLAQRSMFTVVQTCSGRDLLVRRYRVDPRSIVVIPHGTGRSLRSVAEARRGRARSGAPRLLTWGLIGPGKGLEWSLRALSFLKESHPDIRYTIAGRTHPKVLASEGEAYRQSLLAIVSSLGLEDNVDFIDDYLSQDTLDTLLTDTTIAVLPYDSSDQMVSGVLVEAVSATVPVVATTFPHAVELAEGGAVATVPHRRPDSLAGAISRLLKSGTALEEMARAQRRMAVGFEWSKAAREYDQLIGAILRVKDARDVPTAS